MYTKQLIQGLHQAFFNEQHRLVFLYDPEQSFKESVSELDLPDVTVLNMEGRSTLESELLVSERKRLPNPSKESPYISVIELH